MHSRKLYQLIGMVLLISISTISFAEPPSSRRSVAAAKRVKPVLVKSLTQSGLHWGSPVFVRIFKQSKELELWVKQGKTYKKFRTYPICDFSGKLGPKLKIGDLQSPEGFYYVKPGQMNPASMFHLSFNIGFPNRYDRAHGRTGQYLMVHGDCVSIGCYAMTNGKIEEIYALANVALKKGQPFFRVHIFPFRMTAMNMKKYRDSKWIGFWRNLKQGYDYFENKHIPPDVSINRKMYRFR